MTEEAKVVVPEEVVTEEVDTEFETGFDDGKPTEVTLPPVEDAPPEVVEEAPEIKYHQLTEDQWTSLQSLSTQMNSIRADHAKRLDTAFGKVGGLERTLQQLQQATPAGLTVDVTDDIVAEISEEFPELGKRTLAAFKTFAGKIKGTGPVVQQPQTETTVDVESHVQKEVQTRLVALQIEALEDSYPAWREVTGAPDSDTPYRKWLAAQPAEYQTKLSSTNSALVITRSLEKFEKDAQAAAAVAATPAVSTRKQQLAAAAVTRGAGGRAPAPTEDDEFNAGFNSA